MQLQHYRKLWPSVWADQWDVSVQRGLLWQVMWPVCTWLSWLPCLFGVRLWRGRNKSDILQHNTGSVWLSTQREVCVQGNVCVSQSKSKPTDLSWLIHRHKQSKIPVVDRNVLFTCVHVYFQVGVSGRHCEECVSGWFGLSRDNPDGCSHCFCSGLSQDCEEQGGLTRVLVSIYTAVCCSSIYMYRDSVKQGVSIYKLTTHTDPSTLSLYRSLWLTHRLSCHWSVSQTCRVQCLEFTSRTGTWCLTLVNWIPLSWLDLCTGDCLHSLKENRYYNPNCRQIPEPTQQQPRTNTKLVLVK